MVHEVLEAKFNEVSAARGLRHRKLLVQLEERLVANVALLVVAIEETSVNLALKLLQVVVPEQVDHLTEVLQTRHVALHI